MLRRFIPTCILTLSVILMFSSCYKVEKLNIGVEKDSLPMSFQNNGKLDGLNVEIAKEVANELKCEVTIKEISKKDFKSSLDNKTVDCIFGYTSNDSDLLFSSPYLNNNKIFAALSLDGPISKVHIVQKNVGLKKDSDSKTIFEKNDIHDLVKKINEYDNDNNGFNALDDKKIVAYITDEATAYYYMANNNGKYKILNNEPITKDTKQTVAFKKENKKLCNAVSKALNKVVENGKASELSKKWLGKDIIIK